MQQKMKNILVSFSGGETSGYMSHLMLSEYPDSKLHFVFANTGQENEETLQFVDRCDKEWNLGVVWVEAVFNQTAGEGTKHRVVSFETAHRGIDLFSGMCEKYGLPNTSYPHCTRELKLQPIKSYMADKGDYVTAIGIRADEYRRVAQGQDSIIYPLVDRFVTKDDVKYFWEKQPFSLGLKDYQGNCVWCWKKSDKKLFNLMDDSPLVLSAPRMLEDKYSSSGNGSDIRDTGSRQMFRGNRTTADLWSDRMYVFLNTRQTRFNYDLACGESCEIYQT